MSQTGATHHVVNGVDTSQFSQVVDSMKDNPELAKCRFRATNKWVQGGHNQARIQGFYANGEEDASRSEPFTHDLDEPPVLVGQDIGANPVEYALSALSGCLTTTLVYYAAMMGVKLNSVQSHLEGELDLRGLLNLDETTRRGYQSIRVTFEIDSDEPREKIEELVKIAKNFSPVCDIVSNSTPVTIELAA